MIADSYAGALDYKAFLLAKSGIFAAYTACGTLPIVFSDGSSGTDGLVSGTHFLERGEGRDHQRIATAANEWYRGHGVAQQAARWIDELGLRAPAETMTRP